MTTKFLKFVHSAEVSIRLEPGEMAHLILDGGHEQMHVTLPAGEERRILGRLRRDIDEALGPSTV